MGFLNTPMKKFSLFVKENWSGFTQPVWSPFIWEDGDVQPVMANLTEWTVDKPLAERGKAHFRSTTEPQPGSLEHADFDAHNHTLSPAHHQHISYYKGDSYSTNYYLRHQKHRQTNWGDTTDKHPAQLHDHIIHMDEVTSHPISEHRIGFRGGLRGDISKFTPGYVFQDHGYTGTTPHASVAAGFSGQYNARAHSGKPVVHVIHMPPGTKAHYIDIHHPSGDLSADENEVVLHRGTKFKVTHHSEDKDYHYIHSRVVGQKPRKVNLPAPRSGKPYIEGHHDDDGVVMTKHSDEKNPAIKKKLKIAASMAKAKEKL